ncbi:hypothetical protein SODALDRAFT_326611 [Sodiomyces alkalinus F11]|uniref:Uncharacterized protein n=1 Tax=Sodiomyces alkalinus (strain CBS 110278 / VKM F-3762 / F11) TaxID=1314773 RepID=A0A3N2Q6Q2_SODAK|nr:hypothetical protein SODALDRAFT_326611 [Sodiomyces alkalinus F11]ROT42451.1 hypothetical protein SODALDRAFT_326611 [Sodiomyces alkalinus F11]
MAEPQPEDEGAAPTRVRQGVSANATEAAAARAPSRTTIPSTTEPTASSRCHLAQAQSTTLPQARQGERDRLPQRYFDPSNLSNESLDENATPGSRGKPPDDNRANLGRTLRILQDRLPTLLQTPLQQDILAPNISLHLFPSTHPHLPTVSGRVAYTAALWTSPIAWNRVPVIGNVKLAILSARMTREPVPGAPLRQGSVPDQLVVRWCTCGGPGHGSHDHLAPAASDPTTSSTSNDTNINSSSNNGNTNKNGGKRSNEKHFSGLFIFQFDREGRILSHTIETVEGGGDWEKGMGAKFVGLTDWLLGGLGRAEPSPAFRRLPDRFTGPRPSEGR